MYYDLDIDHLKAEVYKRFRGLHIEPPTTYQVERLTKSTIFSYENRFFEDTFRKLPKDSIAKMNILINDLTFYDETEIDYNTDGDCISFSDLRSKAFSIKSSSIEKLPCIYKHLGDSTSSITKEMV